VQGFAHIEFNSPDAATKALELSGQMFMGRELKIYKAVSKIQPKDDPKST